MSRSLSNLSEKIASSVKASRVNFGATDIHEKYGLHYFDKPSEEEEEVEDDELGVNSCSADCCDRDCECDDCLRCTDAGTVGEDSMVFHAAAG
ncbi:MAG: hypothetical protein ACYC7D_12625 [Nitrososphaerales archaeon]